MRTSRDGKQTGGMNPRRTQSQLVFVSVGLMSWWSRSWLSGPPSVTDKYTTSFPSTSSDVPTSILPSGTGENHTGQNVPVTGSGDWVVVTETPEQKTTQSRVSVSTESYSGESRVLETEGSSWGDTYTPSQTPLTSSTTAHGREARGEIQYRRRNKPKRLNPSTTEMTTTGVQSTATPSAGSYSSGNSGSTISTSADESPTASFGSTVAGGVEPDLSSTEAVRKNHSVGEEGEMFSGGCEFWDIYR